MADLFQNVVGNQIYVWSKVQDKPSPEANSRCIISAHGGQSIINSTFTIGANVNLVFYCPHGQSLAAFGLIDLMRGMKKSYETLPARGCQDYYLTKFQNANSSENYNTIKGAGDMFDRQARIASTAVEVALEAAGENPTDDQVEEISKALKKLDAYDDAWKDIVTIRKRPLLSDMTLSQVIEELGDKGYNYTEIHCSFCRSPSLPWKKSDTYTAPNA